MIRTVATLAILLAVALPGPGLADPDPLHFDALAEALPDRKLAMEALAPGERILHDEPRLGLPTFLWTAGARSEPPASPGEWEQAAFAAIRDRADLYRLSPAVLEELRPRAVHDLGRGPVVVTFYREVGGIEVFRDELRVVLDRKADPVAIAGYVAPVHPMGEPFGLAPGEAIAKAARSVGASVEPEKLSAAGTDAGGFARFKGEGLNRPARVRPVYFHLPEGLVPAFHVELDLGDVYAAFVIDARKGSLLYRRNLVQDYSYRVWADRTAGNLPFDGPQGTNGSPHPHGEPTRWQAPLVDPVSITLTSGPISTGDPWLPVGATETVGNNVDAYVDWAAPDGRSGSDFRAPLSGPNQFDWWYDVTKAPRDPAVAEEQGRASVTQLFYVTNYLHDWFYDAGFDESWRNAQQDNFGRGGSGGDRLLAEAQDYSGTNNANMATPADGDHPRLQMYTFFGNFDAYLLVSGAPPAGSSTGRRYTVGLAGFGPDAFDVSGPLVLADDGSLEQDGNGSTTDLCQPSAIDLAGKVVLVDRGTCTFASKAQRAAEAGAIGIVIVNHEDDTAPGMSGEGDSIPIVSVGRSDGELLRQALLGGESLTVRLFRERPIDRDSALDTTIVVHEFTHMVSNRLVGNAAGLGSSQASALGEGWSDFMALLFLVREEDAGTNQWGGTWAIGPWVSSGGANTGYYFGMRRYPYSVDFRRNPLTFRHIAAGEPLPPYSQAPFAWGQSGNWNAGSHQSGEVWATMLWECFVALLRESGLPFAEARQRMLELTIAGMKIAPNDPTFLEARDALLAAAWASDADEFQIFLRAFARRGAGVGARGPERWSTNHAGVVESFGVGARLEIVSISVEEIAPSCDSDGILDRWEEGRITVRVHNVGNAVLQYLEGRVETTTPDVSIANDGRLLFADLAPFQIAEASVPVTVSADRAQILQLAVRLDAPALDEPVEGQHSTWVHIDELPGTSWVDTFDSVRQTWTPVAPIATNGEWSRVYVPDQGFRWVGSNRPGRSDHQLVSPPLRVGTEAPLRITFDHRYQFERLDGQYLAGGVVEVSADGNQWIQVEAPYTGVVSNVGFLNPLAGRSAFVGRNRNWPDLTETTINLGMDWAGQTVRIRFRVGGASALGSAGWEIARVAVEEGSLEAPPFVGMRPEDGICGELPPVVEILGPSHASAESVVALDAGGSYDPEGAPLSFTWYQRTPDGGPQVIWQQQSGPIGRFVAPAVVDETPIQIEVLVDDGTSSALASHTVVIHPQDQPPVARVIAPASVVGSRVATLDGSGSFDPEGAPLTYRWVQIAGRPVELDDPRGPVVHFTAPEHLTPQEGQDDPNLLTFSLIVSDGRSWSAPETATVWITDRNQPPVAVVGPPLEVDERSSVVFADSGGIDPENDPLTYVWTQVAGTPGTLLDAETAAPTLLAPEVREDETLRFSLQVSDGEYTSEPVFLDVLVRNVNRAPIAALPPEVRVRTGATVRLDASASEDPDDEPLTFAWRQVLGDPVETSPVDAAVLTFVAPEEPTLLAFEVEVQDPLGAAAVAEVLVRVERPEESGGGCGCSSGGGAAMVQLGAFAVVALALRRRRVP